MKNRSIHIKCLTWIIVLFVQSGFAQLLKQRDSYVVYINYPDYTVKTSVSNSGKKIPVNETLTYFWYSSNRILQTKGAYDGKLIDGPYTSFFLSNNLKEKGNFKNGLKEGKWMSWYDNGKIDEVTNWSHGKKSGAYKKFNKDESLDFIAHYKNDKLHGKYMTYTSGEVSSVTRYKNGKEVIKIKKTKDSLHSRKMDLSKVFKKDAWAGLFKKKGSAKKDSVQNTPPAEPKRTDKNKNSLFKKKEKKPDAKNESVVEPPKASRPKKEQKDSKKKAETAQEKNK
jgi:hypothetical protein